MSLYCQSWPIVPGDPLIRTPLGPALSRAGVLVRRLHRPWVAGAGISPVVEPLNANIKQIDKL